MDDQYLSTCILGRQVPGAHILPCISLSPAKVHEYTKICLWLEFALDISSPSMRCQRYRRRWWRGSWRRGSVRDSVPSRCRRGGSSSWPPTSTPPLQPLSWKSSYHFCKAALFIPTCLTPQTLKQLSGDHWRLKYPVVQCQQILSFSLIFRSPRTSCTTPDPPARLCQKSDHLYIGIYRVPEVGNLSARAKMATKLSLGAYLLFSRQMRRFCTYCKFANVH